MNVVDSSAWLEYFAAGPNAELFAPAIEDPGELLVPAVVILEVARRVMQQRGEDAALQATALLHQGQVEALDGALALSAARIGIECRLPLADSIIIATARKFGATVWTMDADLEGLPDVRYFPKRG